MIAGSPPVAITTETRVRVSMIHSVHWLLGESLETGDLPILAATNRKERKIVNSV